jgi:phosphoglycerate dehydrogenase-like enzyme
MSVVPDPADAPRLRYIHFNVAGIDHVAHKPALRSPNITVTTSTGGSAIAVAEWVFGSILMHARQLFQLKIWQNKNIWGRLSPSTPTTSLDGQKIGIIGYGSIGRQGELFSSR